MNKQRLQNVARALRESPNPEAFTMATYTHEGEYDGDEFPCGTPAFPCGTPACAMGHYAARRDLQDEFAIAADGIGLAGAAAGDPEPDVFARHFDISRTEALELFSGEGCGDAQTSEEAAQYIEAFVARKEAEANRG